MTNNEKSIDQIKSNFEKESILKFTIEGAKNNEISFLDVNIKLSKDKKSYETSVHIKSTNDGSYINFKSNCLYRYKIGVIKTLLHRAYLISSNWDIFDSELTRIKQMLVNNSFPLFIIDKTINNFISTKLKTEKKEDKENINLFYCNQRTINNH